MSWSTLTGISSNFSTEISMDPLQSVTVASTLILIKAFHSFPCSYGTEKIFIFVSQFSFQSSWAVLQIHMGGCPQLINISQINWFPDRLSLDFIFSFCQVLVNHSASILAPNAFKVCAGSYQTLLPMALSSWMSFNLFPSPHHSSIWHIYYHRHLYHSKTEQPVYYNAQSHAIFYEHLWFDSYYFPFWVLRAL